MSILSSLIRASTIHVIAKMDCNSSLLFTVNNYVNCN